MPMTLEEAKSKARGLLERGMLVAGTFASGDIVGQPSDERVEQVAQMILRSEVEA